MRHIPCTQGTPEWIEARLGIPTASNFKKIVTPKKLELSDSHEDYIGQLIAEWLIGESMDDEFLSKYVDRGSELEAAAAKRYEFETNNDTRLVGFCMRDDIDAGASPDRFVGPVALPPQGCYESKCPGAKKHTAYMINPEKLRAEYAMQTQGQLWVTGLPWCDLVSYHPLLPMVIVRVTPIASVFDAFDQHIPAVCERLAELRERFAKHKRPRRQWPTRDEDPFATNDYENAANWTTTDVMENT